MTKKSLKIFGQGGVGEDISRRDFLKLAGAASAAGIAGCADSPRQKILPFVEGDEDQIPGVAVWYRTSCSECAAGCGIQVRTRDGRAVKIEGNPDHPINKGGVCAIGHSALQDLYDPDRVRQPLKRVKGSGGEDSFEPISWKEAYSKISAKLKKQGKGKRVLFSGGTSGAQSKLIKDWSAALGVEHYVFAPTDPVAVAKASELTFDKYGVPTYRFDQADVIINFGADFMESWLSPVEFSRGWADSRKSSHPVKVVHVEPRLSLTGANADLWINSKPGHELMLVLALMKVLYRRGRLAQLKRNIALKVKELTQGIDIKKVSSDAGIKHEKLLLMAQYLEEAKSPLVIAGGAVGTGTNALDLQVATNLLSLMVGSIGRTVFPDDTRAPQTDLVAFKKLIDTVNKGKQGLDLAFITGTNPEYNLPESFGFKYALKKCDLVVSFSSHLDETTRLADIIIPSHTPLESWRDQTPRKGIHNLLQPVMQPVFDTKQLEDQLLDIAAQAGVKGKVTSASNFEEYLKSEWQELFNAEGGEGDFEKFWLTSLEKGGHIVEHHDEKAPVPAVKLKSFDLKFDTAKFSSSQDGGSQNELTVLPYPSVKSFDGRAANRPWIQELPDPITHIVWDSWAELHPSTAKRLGIAQGDLVAITNKFGQLNIPAYLTEYVAEDLVAVPIGEGHTAYGRYATEVQGGNVIDLVASNADLSSGVLPLFSVSADVKRGRGHDELVITQGSYSQMDRHLAQTETISNDHHGGHHDDHHGHHEPKQMYEQRIAPVYDWGMAIDLAACTGCSACVVACYAENNIPVVGKKVAGQGREMSWLKIDQYKDGSGEELQVTFQPMMCQHCNNAPCEPVCPVYATYHNEEGMNVMVYNRCVGTRYCGNNCSYKVRRYNWFEFDWPAPMDMQLNPDVTKRVAGVMEKCSFCAQRIREGVDQAKDEGRVVRDGEVQPACVQSCPTKAISFGNLNDSSSEVSKLSHEGRAYKVLDHHLNTQPSVSYLKNKRYKI